MGGGALAFCVSSLSVCSLGQKQPGPSSAPEQGILGASPDRVGTLGTRIGMYVRFRV